MGIYYRISKVLSEKVREIVKTTSTQVNTVYITQWLLITYVIGVKELLGIGFVSDAWIVPTGIIFAFASIIIARIYTNASGKLRGKCA